MLPCSACRKSITSHQLYSKDPISISLHHRLINTTTRRTEAPVGACWFSTSGYMPNSEYIGRQRSSSLRMVSNPEPSQ